MERKVLCQVNFLLHYILNKYNEISIIVVVVVNEFIAMS